MSKYPEATIAPMREELVRAGFRQLMTPADVDEALERPGTTLLVLNSICGCAAGALRPGVVKAVQERALPFDQLVTVFAGMETEAVARVRERFGETSHTSPNLAIFKDGRLVRHMPRKDVEKLTADQIADTLEQVVHAQ